MIASIRRRRAASIKPATRMAGFSMIEVMIALLVLAIGLLGFALLQTMNLRFTQSANQRTQATNLAYDLLDQMRANRFQAAWYSTASFNAGDVTRAGCGNPPTGAVTLANSVTRWRCQVVNALGDGASANVTYVNGVATVGVAWNDERWEEGGDAISAVDLRNAFSLTTRL
ncbi:MAG: type IV pilus modification protein PilV [Luteimonas sp.]|nr:type IV pilus modification protein PilV [Luteimonas sp.]